MSPEHELRQIVEELRRLSETLLLVLKVLENQDRLLRRIEKLLMHQGTYPAPTALHIMNAHTGRKPK